MTFKYVALGATMDVSAVQPEQYMDSAFGAVIDVSLVQPRQSNFLPLER